MLYFGWQDDDQWNIVNLPLLKRMFCPLGPTDASPSRRLRHRDGHQAACLTASLMVNANVNQHNSQQPIHVLNHASQRSSYKIKLQLIEVTKNIFKKIESCHMKPLVLCWAQTLAAQRRQSANVGVISIMTWVCLQAVGDDCDNERVNCTLSNGVDKVYIYPTTVHYISV